jgi:hypothetical protein
VSRFYSKKNRKPNSPKEKLSLLSLFNRPAGKKKKVSLSSSLKFSVFLPEWVWVWVSANKYKTRGEEIKKKKKRKQKVQRRKDKRATMCDRLIERKKR